jgi:hypothetical protein
MVNLTCLPTYISILGRMTGQKCDRYEVTKLQNVGTTLDYKAEVGKLLQDSPAQPDGEMESEWQKMS